jgi:hypothetical protein
MAFDELAPRSLVSAVEAGKNNAPRGLFACSGSAALNEKTGIPWADRTLKTESESDRAQKLAPP